MSRAKISPGFVSVFWLTRRKHCPLLVVFSCILMLASVQAQHANITFEHYTTEHGLSAPVTIVTQDRHGFLWFGTTDGLNRFDGTNFVVYRNMPGDSTMIPSNIINALHVDHKGRVWAATNGGLCYYDFGDDRFHTVPFDVSLEKLDQYRAHGVCSDSTGTIWFATRTILHRWREGQSVKSYPLPQYGDVLIKYVFIDVEDLIWIGSNAGLCVFDQQNEQFHCHMIASAFSESHQLAVTVHPIVPYREDTLWIGSWYAGLQKVYHKQGEVINISLPDQIETDSRRHIVSGIAQGINGHWWIGTYGNGLAWFDSGTNQFIDHFHHTPSDAKSLSSDYINDVFTDATGVVWVGTAAGLDKYDPLAQQFKSIRITVPPGQFGVYRLPNTIVEDKQDPNVLWTSISGVGLFRFNRITHEFKLYQLEQIETNQLTRNNIYSFYTDTHGRNWIGTRTGVYLFDAGKGRFLPSPLSKEMQVNGAHTIFQDQNGNYWFATNGEGVYMFDENQNQIRSYKHNPADSTSIPDNKVFCMMVDSKGKIWVGTQNRGLFRIDPETDNYLFFEHDKANPNGIPDNGIYDLYEDPNHTLWIATENGLAAMNLTTTEIQNYSIRDGLCNNTILSITADHRNHLWLATNNGLSNFDPDTKKFRNYYTIDGLPMNRIAGEVFYTSDSTLYLGTTDMLSFCKPEEMKTNKHIPAVVITDISILGKKVPVIRDKGIIQPIHLSYKENMITFNFSALSFSNAFLNQYAYKMDGFDDQWIPCGTRQSATYTNLDGGTYTFHVKGSNSDGLWNEESTRVLLYVHPPFWSTIWFYLLCIAAIAGILYALYRVRINQLIRLQNIRTRIARDLHDDIGSTLSSINMMSSMADRRDETGKKSSELFSTISSASGQALELMNDIVWSINPKNDRLEMILIRMRQYASEILEAADIRFSIEMDEDSKHILMPLEIRKDFYLIFKEAINNLAKYSRAKSAKIKLRYRNQMIELLIEDDGVGFDTQERSQGNGLKNMKARAAQLQGSLAIKSTSGAGTAVELQIPVNS